MASKGDSNIVHILLIVAGFLIVTAVIVGIVLWMKSGSDTGASCLVKLIRGTSDEGCKIFR